jgi:hypothetical protein
MYPHETKDNAGNNECRETGPLHNFLLISVAGARGVVDAALVRSPYPLSRIVLTQDEFHIVENP